MYELKGTSPRMDGLGLILIRLINRIRVDKEITVPSWMGYMLAKKYGFRTIMGPTRARTHVKWRLVG